VSGDFSDITKAFDNARVRLAGPADTGDNARVRLAGPVDTGDYSALGRHFDVTGPQPPLEAPEPRDHSDGITDADIATEMREGLGLKPVLEPQLLPTDSAERKRMPVYSGVVKYFPRALAYVAQISFAGNEKHNPGQPLHWSRDKSSDHLDCAARHLIDAGRVDPEDGLLHDGKLVWRALANLELKLESMETK
jgi:hypothetical protein